MILGSVFTLTVQSNAQHATFENPLLTAESAWYGQDQVTDGDTIYNSGDYNFELNYNAGWGSFDGWAISNVTDNTTVGWANQFSAITGSDYNSGTQYGICYATSWNNHRVFTTFSDAVVLDHMVITNTTYAYYAMLDGDDFSKPFGADTNAQGIIDGTNGEDWFKLTIYGLGLDSVTVVDSIEFYLADYRFTDDAQDYIVDTWTPIDLSVLGPVKGLDFKLSSSDTSGGFGMNTPAYFAAGIIYHGYVGMNELTDQFEFEMYPNPTSGNINFIVPEGARIIVHDLSGKVILEKAGCTTQTQIDLSGFNPGVYVVSVHSNGINLNKRIVKL